MRKFNFVEAVPFINFIKENENILIGSTLKKLHTLHWPEQNWSQMTEDPVVMEIDNYCVGICYFIPSDIEIIVGKKDEFEMNLVFKKVMNIRNTLHDYYNEEFGRGVKKELIEDCVINKIEIARFTDAFECNPITEEVRPDGGDYFSTVRIYLNSGVVLCLCGAESICDGYMYIWCE